MKTAKNTLLLKWEQEGALRKSITDIVQGLSLGVVVLEKERKG